MYTKDRARRLRLAIRVVILISGLLAGLGVTAMVTAPAEYRVIWAVLTSSSLLMLGTAVIAIRALERNQPRARTLITLNGVLVMLSGIFYIQWILGIGLVGVGLVELVLARARDEEPA